MKSKFCLGVLMTVLVIPNFVFSQTISPEVSVRFNASIVNKVYELNKYVTLSNSQQMQLARLLNKKDSTIAVMLAVNRPTSQIDSFSERIQKEIYSLNGVRKYFDSAAATVASLAAQTELRYYARFRPSPDCLYKIKSEVINKHQQLALINRLDISISRKDSLQKAICKKQDSLVEMELIKDGSFISSSQFVAAVKFRRLLKLTDEQTDSLLSHGIHLTDLRDSAWNISPLTPFDTKDYENYHLSKILTDEQYSTLLKMRYLPDAKKNAEDSWADLERRGLTKGMDKESTINELTNYYIRLKSSSSLYAFDSTKQSAFARSVKDNPPNALKLLLYAIKRNITSATNQTLNNQW